MNSKQVTTFSMIIGISLVAYILYIKLELKKTKALLNSKNSRVSILEKQSLNKRPIQISNKDSKSDDDNENNQEQRPKVRNRKMSDQIKMFKQMFEEKKINEEKKLALEFKEKSGIEPFFNADSVSRPIKHDFKDTHAFVTRFPKERYALKYLVTHYNIDSEEVQYELAAYVAFDPEKTDPASTSGLSNPAIQNGKMWVSDFGDDAIYMFHGKLSKNGKYIGVTMEGVPRSPESLQMFIKKINELKVN
jgi:hypothetical protein